MAVDGLWWDLVGLRVAALRWDSSGKVRIGDGRGSGILRKLYHEVWKMQTRDRHAALGRLRAMRRIAGQAPTPTPLASEAADRPSAASVAAHGRIDIHEVEAEAVRVGTRVGRRGPMAADVAGVVQRAGVDPTSWDEVVRSFGKNFAHGSIGTGGKTVEVVRVVTIPTGGETPAFGADGVRSILILDSDIATTCTSRSGIPLVVVAGEIVGVVGIAIDDGTISAFFSHSGHRRNIGPVGA